MLPQIHGEFVLVRDPEIKFNDSGKAWVTARCVAKDRVRDANGNWVDGDPLFIDVIVLSQAENLCESACKGDSIIVTGKLRFREYDHNGEKRGAFSILAESVGVGVRFGSAKTRRLLESSKTPVQAAQDILGGEIIQSDEAPF